ncbi:MAG: saccharopine dehydrogenase NADP-binding domain-containing protein [Nitrososphaerales archaeon]|nr:saccharopine dehydrogenase NADP-binding domain-containing protein [Nitrososphaerales archaeon]
MKVGVLGSGLMGSVIAWDLARSPEVDQVVVADLDAERLARVRSKVGGQKLSTVKVNFRDKISAVAFMQGFDVVASALPHGTVNAVNLAAVESGVKMVDIAFEDSQMGLAETASNSGALLIPGCGLAPGLAGILLAHGVALQRGADEGHILVGGLPQKPQPPFGYRLVFSVVGLIREYTDEARVFRNGKVVKVKPFSTVERVRFPPPIGALEAFCTDGLASLVYTMKGMRVMDEKTLRWPGHAERMSLLLESGFFSAEKLRMEAGEVSPIEMSWKVLEKKLSEGPPEDLTVMRVEARARRSEVIYELVDRYDRKDGITSMGRTTGFTCSIVTQMVGSGKIQGKGVIPPEMAVTGEGVEMLVSELAKRGVKITERRRAKKS